MKSLTEGNNKITSGDSCRLVSLHTVFASVLYNVEDLLCGWRLKSFNMHIQQPGPETKQQLDLYRP